MSDENTIAKVIEQLDNLRGYDKREYGLRFVGPGWHGLVNPIYDRVAVLRARGEDVSVEQVKEKFGTLRIYVRSTDDELHAMIEAAERQSGETCEICGKPGERRDLPGVQTLCDEH